MPALTSSRRRCLAVLCALLSAGGCSTGPDLRPAGGDPRSASAASGRELLEEGRATEAVTAFRTLIRREGATLHNLNGLAIAYSELGKPDLAAEIFSRALAIAPGDPATLNNIGFSALRRADALLARHYLEKANAIRSGHEEIEGNLAGLAWLEKMDRNPRSNLASMHASPRPAIERSPSIDSLKRPKKIREASSALFVPAARPAGPPQRTMIDFTTVIDPFVTPPPVK